MNSEQKLQIQLDQVMQNVVDFTKTERLIQEFEKRGVDLKKFQRVANEIRQESEDKVDKTSDGISKPAKEAKIGFTEANEQIKIENFEDEDEEKKEDK